MLKAGILGGGQLGRMLLQAAANYPVETFVLENDAHCPSAHLCEHFVKGDIRNYDDVYAFGKMVDALTIEIENVNVEALEQLEKEGLAIYPRPSVLRTIKNKILQKQYYKENEIPSPAFVVTQSKSELAQHTELVPAVHKMGEGGYDGKGVQLIREKADLDKGFDVPSVLEKMVNIRKEIAVMVAMNKEGETALYPPVEMIFDPVLNLLDYQLCPADLDQRTLWKAEAIALSVVRNFKSPGIYAVELFVNAEGDVLVNETAPRVHNSGHHTIEAHYSSQFDMLWRIILGYPLGNTDPILPSAMINLVGAEGLSGPAVYEGLEEVLKIDSAFVHIYGKKETKPGRKMGHVTVIAPTKQDLLFNANKVKNLMKVTSILNRQS
ncbi:MAG: 5-(carboxyamino)imidazole ribonucleotide synthase [Sphingobacteriales bacterium SCN 48-20]|uniref:5-(carboxyamino)imidazole ribonucleotide synthase n=1 Tax=Terrimonas ferruginea TaxID=249 RepID=UPI000869B74C|nr:5-(carboxyamino)imidazole ribonucleotide synthase [Terrimonas ferruginea]MBN8782854.1 5-(carboxyamino)imidazole ribonucleotide synthase [Terrimonas ferruginea]ODT92781.1 MAG: 5-(carboxyamino)imidazole ribonucleotide synthase [Sphingobacteriales bacterium SCN 48-20]OJW44052.1 MAG: 5-(carboxyamino)imidazole ribonucleotide synthase [Sphingobacteriales bacterium 48-107]